MNSGKQPPGMSVWPAVLLVIVVGLFLFLNASVFTVQQISVEGVSEAHSQQVYQSLPIAIGDNIWQFDASEVESKLMEMPWMQSVTVERQLPNELKITVTEWQPVLSVPWQDQFLVLNEQALVIDHSSEPVSGVPVLTGVALSGQAGSPEGQILHHPAVHPVLSLLRQLQAQDLSMTVSEMQWDNGDVTLFTGNRTMIRLGKLPLDGGWDRSVQVLDEIWNDLKQRDDLPVKAIDLQDLANPVVKQ